MTEPPSDSQLPTFSPGGPDRRGEEGAQPPQIEGYEVRDKLGEAGQGQVWRARQLSTGQEVALKFPHEAALLSDAARARFEREVELAASLQHPNIARVYDSGLYKGVYWYAMELVEGVHLDQYVEEHHLAQREILELVGKVARAVQHAHQHGVIHRDLKPSNVLVTGDGQPHVVDFGLAKAFLEGEAALMFSVEGYVAGTPAYMSPEQAAGHVSQVDTRSDVYGLGVILFRLLTGEFPHDHAGGRDALLARIAGDEVRRPRQVGKDIDKELEALLLKALAHDPDGRYATAGDLAQDIRNYLTGEPLTARKPTTVYFLRKRLRKYRVPAAIAGGVLALLIGMAVFSYVRVEEERRKAVFAYVRVEEERSKAEEERSNAEEERSKAEEERRKAVFAYVRVDEERSKAEEERSKAEEERRKAVFAYVRVEEERRKADEERRKAEEERRKAERFNYANTIALAEIRVRDGLFDEAQRLLGNAPTELRGWEWGRLCYLSDREILTLKGHSDSVWSAAFSPDGRRVVTASMDETAKIWDAQTGKVILTLNLNAQSAIFQSAAFSPDGRRVLTAGFAATPRIWDAETGQELLTLKGHSVWVTSAAFSPDGRRVVTGAWDQTARIWDAETGKELLTLKGHSGGVVSAAFSRDGRRVVTASADKTAKIWDAETAQELLTLKGHSDAVWSAAFSPDGRRVVTATWHETARIWDAETGKELLTLKGHLGGVQSAAFSPDGRYVVTASGGMDGTAKIWDAETGNEFLTLKAHFHYVRSAAFSPDGRRVVTAGMDKTAKIWDAETGRKLLMPKGHSGPLRSAAFSPDGRRVVTGSADHTARIWDAETGNVILTLKGHRAPVISAAFSPDGRRVVTASSDKTARIGTPRIWDAETGEELLTLKGHSGPVFSAAFSPDGRRVVTASGAAAKIWDAETGKELLTLKGHSLLVLSAAFSPDGRRVLTINMDETARIWPARDWTKTVEALRKQRLER